MQATADLLAWAEKKGTVWDKWPAGPKSEAWRARVENYLTDPTKEPDPAKWGVGREDIRGGRATTASTEHCELCY
jgi:hypothetical protein